MEIQPTPSHNQPAYTVSELSGAVKRVMEDSFSQVRVRGEIGKVSRHASGHIYFDLKDERSVLAGVCWKGSAGRLSALLETGLEVIASGRLTTFGAQSKYQLIVEHLEPAGAGALLALLEQRKKQLAAEGLFDPARKKALPYLPRVIGVVTSPTGAVIRDILHRVSDRFPCHVLLWPVRVQGEGAAQEIAAAIAGFNQLPPGGNIPRPDVLIVGRGGGSVEDLWCFNEEIVVRAAAASDIPLISAVGHETDTTLIDYAADRRAPTPTAAAEMALPVRADLHYYLMESGLRMVQSVRRGLQIRADRLQGLSRGLPRPEDLLGQGRQRLDGLSERLAQAPRHLLRHKQAELQRHEGTLAPHRLLQRLQEAESLLRRVRGQLAVSGRVQLERQADGLERIACRLSAELVHQQIARRRDQVAALGRMLQTLNYEEVLRRGFVLVRDVDGAPVTAVATLPTRAVSLQFHDGSAWVQPLGGGASAPPVARRKQSKPTPADGSQGSLL
jgi:exodeoxyribonuclease VII large subunit